MWVPLRSAISVGMLLPIINGYSLVQIRAISFAGMDFQSADLAWRSALNHICNSGLVVQISPSDSEALLLALYKSNLCMLSFNSVRSGASVPRCLAHLVGNVGEAGTACAMAGSLGSNYISALRYANLRTHVQDSV